MLTYVMLLPLLGALLILGVVRGDDQRAASEARLIALFTTVATFFGSLFAWIGFDNSKADFQFVEKYDWFSSLNISYHVGIDGISLCRSVFYAAGNR